MPAYLILVDNPIKTSQGLMKYVDPSPIRF